MLLLIEIIRISIGTGEGLSRIPSSDDWKKLFLSAQKHALIGICFAGIQKLRINGDVASNLPDSLFIKWLSCASTIIQRNELMDTKCSELQCRLLHDGLNSLILKGQGTATYYGKELKNMRQSGDIDVWVLNRKSTILNWIKGKQDLNHCDYMHTRINIFSDVEVEVHFRPWMSRNFIRNYRLQRFSMQYIKEDRKDIYVDGFKIPDRSFAIVHAIQHLHWHLLTEGVGLRQMLDLYFLLLDYRDDTINNTLDWLNLLRFTSGLMWVLSEIFGLKKENMLCNPNNEEGMFLLKEMMEAGNFGHYDKRIQHQSNENKYLIAIKWIRHSFRLAKHYPIDVLLNPIGIVYYSIKGKM